MAGRWIFIVFVTGSEPPPPIYGTKATHLSVNSNKSLKQQFIYRKSTPEWQMAMNWNWYTPKIWAKPPQGSSMRPGRQHQKGQKQHKDEYTHTRRETERAWERSWSKPVGGVGCAPERNWFALFAHRLALAGRPAGGVYPVVRQQQHHWRHLSCLFCPAP